MTAKNMSEDYKAMIIKAAKGMDKRMAEASSVKDREPEISQAEADEAYIIELFSITEDQVAEIKQLKAKIAAQDELIEKMQKKMKAAGIDAESEAAVR